MAQRGGVSCRRSLRPGGASDGGERCVSQRTKVGWQLGQASCAQRHRQGGERFSDRRLEPRRQAQNRLRRCDIRCTTAEHGERGCGTPRYGAEPRRLGLAKIDAASRADMLRDQRGLDRRRDAPPADRAAVEQPSRVPKARNARRHPPLLSEVGEVIRLQALRAELQPGRPPAVMADRVGVRTRAQE